MVLGWRRAFCTTIPRDKEKQDHTNPSPNPSPSPRLASKFKFFSSSSDPSTPRLHSQQPISSPNNNGTLRCKTTPPPSSTSTVSTPQFPAESPKLRCKTTTTKNSPRFFNFSYPSSPRSPSTFSFLKSSLRNSKTKCCLCSQAMKTGQGTAIFTAECCHSFHFPCVAAHVQKESALICPVCNACWKEMPLLSIHNVVTSNSNASPRTIHVDNNYKIRANPNQILKVYNDDEPLMSPTSGGGRFNPIPESDEENGDYSSNISMCRPNVSKRIDVMVSPDAAVISSGRSSETYAITLRLRGPAVVKRAPIDLVTVLDVSGRMNSVKLLMMKRVLRIVLSSLSSADRLSIVAFSTASKRLLPLRRMSPTGRRSARRIVEAVVAIEGTVSSSDDALKKAVKVLEDRRDKNPTTSIILLSDGEEVSPKRRRIVSSSRFPNLEIPVHAISMEIGEPEEILVGSIGNILSVVVQDLSVRLGFISGSAPTEIAAVYESLDRVQGSGGVIRVGELYAEEERELLVELKVPSSSSATRAQRVLSVRCSYKDPSTQELINCREQALLVPRPHTVRSSSTPDIQRLRSRFIASRALAEARRLIERNDLGGAHHMLASSRALLLQSRPGSGSGIGPTDEFVRALEGELSELSRKKLSQQRDVERDPSSGIVYLDEKAEPLTPTSAWRAAEKLAKLAVLRKSMNRVSDLHGFENARF